MNTGLSYHEEKDFENMNNEDSPHPEQGEQGEYRWRDASEPPKHTDEVLVWRKSKHVKDLWYHDCAAYGFFGEEIWGSVEGDNFTVSHWMELPKPPCKLSSPPPEGQDELWKQLYSDILITPKKGEIERLSKSYLLIKK